MNEQVFYKTKEEALKNVKINGRRLKFCSDELKNDYDVCLAAVKDNGLALQFVPEQFKADKEIVLSAIDENSYAIHFVSSSFEGVDEISRIIQDKHVDFFKHSDLMYSDTYKDKTWEEKAIAEYKMLKELEEEALREDPGEDEEEM